MQVFDDDERGLLLSQAGERGAEQLVHAWLGHLDRAGDRIDGVIDQTWRTLTQGAGDRCVREACGVEIETIADEHPYACGAESLGPRGDQPSLSDAGFPGDEDQARLSGRNLGKEIPNTLQFGFTTDQRRLMRNS